MDPVANGNCGVLEETSTARATEGWSDWTSHLHRGPPNPRQTLQQYL